MKLKASDAVAATARSPMNWFLGICLPAFLAIVSASGAVPQSDAEKWVVKQATAGGIADLSRQFPEEKDRRLSAHFLEELLTGALPRFKPHRQGVMIIGAIIEEPISLTNAQIPCNVVLSQCQFMSDAFFVQARFTGIFVLDGSRFKAKAAFVSMKAGLLANIEHVVFEGPVDFVGADIAESFNANEARFQNKEQAASFNSMKVGRNAYFRKAVFEGPVDFVGADIAKDFNADEAQFQNKEEAASFNSMKVGGGASFSKAVFEGPVDFSIADISGFFAASEARFKNKDKEANFKSIKVGQFARVDKAVFEGPVDFTGADVVGNLTAQEAKFQNKQKGTTFNGMKVGGAAFFKDAVFEGPVTFRYADFAWLDLSTFFWPKLPAQFDLQGMSYKYIRAAPKESESHKALLTLANRSSYTADVYSKLEEFFLRHGYRSDADWAFIEGKRRERKERLYGLGWLGSLLLDGLVGYGRHPWQAGIPCAVLVALGCVLFSPKKMEPQQPEDTPRVYNRFWYSLGLFLPFVDLQSNKVWKPKANQTFLRNYMRVHIILGWILIPLVLAAVTGLIK